MKLAIIAGMKMGKKGEHLQNPFYSGKFDRTREGGKE
jgi:hypothetical protein